MPNCRLDAIDPEAGTREVLAADLGFAPYADLSPDGRSLLFSRYAVGFVPLGIFVLDLTSGEQRRISHGEFARWSPDGERIVFESDCDRNGGCIFHDCSGFAGEVYVMDADGSNQRRMTNDVAVAGLTTGRETVSGSSSVGSRTKKPAGISGRFEPTGPANAG